MHTTDHTVPVREYERTTNGSTHSVRRHKRRPRRWFRRPKSRG